jgi:uncharacterized protein YegJ (DUF2314 family)
MKNLLFILLLFIITDAVCQTKTKVENNVQYKSKALVKDDGKFLALKDTAQKHMPAFLDSLKKRGGDYENYRFIVKSDFAEKGTHEHMWSQIVGYSNGMFRAIFIDSPFDLKNIKTGDKVMIKKGDVEDWVIHDLKTKKVTGDFSDKYLKSKK